jgi:hypothetical protein
MVFDTSGQPVYPNRIQERIYAPQIEAGRAQTSEATTS